MALSSMTGFARAHGAAGAYTWSWELKSVNGKGLDLRLRLPPGWDAVEAPARTRASETLARGSVYATLTVEREGVAPVVRVNEPVLNAVLATMKSLAGRLDAAPPRLDGILSLKGVVEVIDQDESEDERRAAEAAVVAGFARGVRRARGDAPARRRRLGHGARAAARRDRRAGEAGRSGARPPAGSDQGAHRRAGRDACSMPGTASIRTACIRKRS